MYVRSELATVYLIYSITTVFNYAARTRRGKEQKEEREESRSGKAEEGNKECAPSNSGQRSTSICSESLQIRN